MEFLKHEISLFQNEEESGIRRTAAQYMASPIFQEEKDDITRQRLVFAAILSGHAEVLFNGTSNERSPAWEEVREFMVEQGALTLVDKDWKYVASCYWQNIRKESIRRMAKMKVGAIKTARPGQLELDRLVGDVLNKRGPGSASLETLIHNYGRNYKEGDQNEQATLGASNSIVHLEEPLSNSASPAATEEHLANGTHQAALDQMIRNATIKISQHHHHQQQHSAVAAASIPAPANNPTITTFTPPKPLAQVDAPIQQAMVESSNLSMELGKIVGKTHSQLVAGGYLEMATEFENQLRQMVNGYKAWMFDQIFPHSNEERDGGGEGGPSELKRQKHH